MMSGAAAADAAGSGVAFYVAPDGNDGWSGTSPSARRGNGPFATLARARDAVRDLKRRHGGALKQPVTVFLRGGAYALQEPLLLTTEDSGTEACPVTYAAYRDETPVVSGGRRITGWKPVTVVGRQLWAADIPEARGGRAS